MKIKGLKKAVGLYNDIKARGNKAQLYFSTGSGEVWAVEYAGDGWTLYDSTEAVIVCVIPYIKIMTDYDISAVNMKNLKIWCEYIAQHVK